MTEEEWLAEQRLPKWMLSHLLQSGKTQRTKAGKRRLRLFACGCCRTVWHLLDGAGLRTGVEVAERYADGEEGPTRLAQSAAATSRPNRVDRGDPASMAAWMAWCTCSPRAIDAAFGPTHFPAIFAGRSSGPPEGEALLCHLFREVFGNPFRPSAVKREWVAADDRAAEAVAQSIYDERAFDRMPILADALEDAGCDDGAILGHCRGPGPHVRGCWVVDAILGKG